jgi:predicted DNA-binding ribbon-helix-helix protein
VTHVTTSPQDLEDRGGPLKSQVVKRSIIVANQQTSVSLESAFWHGLKEIARLRNMRLADLATMIDSERQHGNLSSAIRLFVLGYYRDQLAELKDGAKTRETLTSAAATALERP